MEAFISHLSDQDESIELKFSCALWILDFGDSLILSSWNWILDPFHYTETFFSPTIGTIPSYVLFISLNLYISIK